VGVTVERLGKGCLKRSSVFPFNRTDFARRLDAPRLNANPVMRSERTDLHVSTKPDVPLVFPAGDPRKAPPFVLAHRNREPQARPNARRLAGEVCVDDRLVVDCPIGSLLFSHPSLPPSFSIPRRRSLNLV